MTVTQYGGERQEHGIEKESLVFESRSLVYVHEKVIERSACPVK